MDGNGLFLSTTGKKVYLYATAKNSAYYDTGEACDCEALCDSDDSCVAFVDNRNNANKPRCVFKSSSTDGLEENTNADLYIKPATAALMPPPPPPMQPPPSCSDCSDGGDCEYSLQNYDGRYSYYGTDICESCPCCNFCPLLPSPLPPPPSPPPPQSPPAAPPSCSSYNSRAPCRSAGCTWTLCVTQIAGECLGTACQ